VTLRGASCHRAHVAVGALACARWCAEEGTTAGVAAMAEAAAAEMAAATAAAGACAGGA